VPHPVIIGHGRSNAHAIKNAILFVRELHVNQVPRRIEEEVGRFMREHHEQEV
jgi:fatty acid/phospholipid biosynthesis enzyme